MIKFQKIYNENKKLDLMFDELYDASNPDIVRKNKLELLVELGELANEIKAFKYWSLKKPGIKKVKEEYADCLIMVLCFLNYFNVSLEETFQSNKRYYDLVDLFGLLFQLCSKFYWYENRELIKEIFVYFVELGHQLGLNDEEIIESTLKKINKNIKRFKEGF